MILLYWNSGCVYLRDSHPEHTQLRHIRECARESEEFRERSIERDGKFFKLSIGSEKVLQVRGVPAPPIKVYVGRHEGVLLHLVQQVLWDWLHDCEVINSIIARVSSPSDRKNVEDV